MNIELKKMKDVLKFRLEFMILMLNSGRQEEANSMLQRLLDTIDMVEGDYKDPCDVRMDEIRADFAQGRS